MIRVLLADDQAMVREALGSLLDLEDDIEVVAQVGSGSDVVAAARASRAQVCLLDIQMPGLDGIEAAEQLRKELPGVGALIVTTFNRPGYLRRALNAGAKGFVVKDSPAAELAKAVREVFAGNTVFDEDLAQNADAEANPLTPREQEVLRLAAHGSQVRTISETIYLSQGTVRNLLSSAIHKTDASNRIEAARKATEAGWI